MAEPQKHQREAGIFFRCDCGASLRISARLLGEVRHCPKCNAEFTVSSPAIKTTNLTSLSRSISPRYTSSLDSLTTGDATCAICQCPLSLDEERTACVACGLPHHTDCWEQNLGCSAYGCSQVNALKVGPDIEIGSGVLNNPTQRLAQPQMSVDSALSETTSPWEFAILLVSVVCFLAGVVTYGVPCFLAGAVIVAFVFARDGQVNWIALVPAGLICIVGVVIGIISSTYVYAP